MMLRTGRWFKFNSETGRFDFSDAADPQAMPEAYVYKPDEIGGMRLTEITVGEPGAYRNYQRSVSVPVESIDAPPRYRDISVGFFIPGEDEQGTVTPPLAGD